MAVTRTLTAGAERQRRYKRHKAGDHSLCLPGRCDLAGEAPELVTPSDDNPESRRGPRGIRLWQDMASAGLGPAHRVLLEEACRIADRLDRLDAILDGREDWLKLDVGDDGSQVRVSVDGVLAEARQQATTLRGLVAELRAALPKATPTPKANGGGLSDLSARIAARRGASTG